MEPERRPTVPEAISAMDGLIATMIVGQQEFARRFGLSVTDLVCFAYVMEAGDTPVTAGDLAQRAHVTTGAVTGVLNRLERGGFVTRQPDPADRRRVLVVAVPDVVERVVAVYGPFYARLGELFARYSSDELALLTDWFGRAEELARGYLDESR
ncbi:MarR family winged helix-turn-helix transcriptional regulator [Streptomyces sp. NPDC057438]|uniref:MarR family winged helix-turn-helix transcriptional regulator n=1 Tax=Streptomyces sp. NPDC057438 TaxID=3346133 RepID=UPI0036B5FD59